MSLVCSWHSRPDWSQLRTGVSDVEFQMKGSKETVCVDLCHGRGWNRCRWHRGGLGGGEKETLWFRSSSEAYKRSVQPVCRAFLCFKEANSWLNQEKKICQAVEVKFAELWIATSEQKLSYYAQYHHKVENLNSCWQPPLDWMCKRSHILTSSIPPTPATCWNTVK